MTDLKKPDFNNMDYAQIGGGAGVVCGIIFGMHKNFGFGKTALYALLFGAAGVFIGHNYQKISENEK